MKSYSLQELARHYLEVIEEMERTSDKDRLYHLEEKRVIWHNRLIAKFKAEGIPYRDRDDVTRIAERIVKREL